MSDGYRNGAFALGLIVGGALAIIAIVWIIGLNYCPNQPCDYSQAADEPSQNAGERIWQVPDAIRGTFSYEAEPEYAPGNPTRHEYYDLRAQERMAHATDWIVWLTFVTGAVGVAGLGAIIYTLNLQRNANEIALEIGQKQVRAYLFVKSVSILSVVTDGIQDTITPVVVCHNFGQSPASDIQVSLECRIHRNVTDFCSKKSTMIVMSAGDVTGPSSPFSTLFPSRFPAGIIQKIRAGECIFFVSLKITYKDVFGSDDEIRADYFTYGEMFKEGGTLQTLTKSSVRQTFND
ncbi:hypothetical protein [uncultured Tateyamaria sp.]|uniref:hypothetical protein n=1 Tax=uncultured Tateyamaria sp. TaxID=455651 RepID=UPI002630E0F3|nr:hypothetical protein [uncultured Tateyamaria sp.]